MTAPALLALTSGTVAKARKASAIKGALEKLTDEDPRTRPSTIARRLGKVLGDIEKTSELTPKEKRYASYMGLGLAGLPILGMVANRLRTGKWLGGVAAKKFFPEQLTHGAFWGAMPVAAEEIAQKFPDKPKVASAPGQDLRLPITGGTKFPTDDSKDFARKNLEESQGKAEVGPAPLMAKLKPKGPKIKDVTPRPSTSTVGDLPKIGQAMHDDPLIQHLRTKYAMRMETNEDAPTTAPPEPEAKTHEDPTLPTQAEQRGTDPHQDYLRKMFSARQGFRQKYETKEHKPATGLVDQARKR